MTTADVAHVPYGAALERTTSRVRPWASAGVVGGAAFIALATFAYVERTLHGDIEPRLTTKLGVPVHIGAVAANLSGSVELSELTVGSMFAADTVELGASWRSIIGGNFGVDEVILRRFSITARIDDEGLADLHDLYRRVLGDGDGANRPHAATRAGKQGLRLVATEGSVRLQHGAANEVVLRDVDVIPAGEQLRVIAQGVDGSVHMGPYRAKISFARSAADINLATRKVGRALAVAGSGVIAFEDHQETLVGLTASLGIDPKAEAVVTGAFAAHPQHIFNAAWQADDTLIMRGEQVPLALLGPVVGSHVDVRHAEGSGELTVRHALLRRAPRKIEAHGALRMLALAHPMFAAEPVSFDLKGEIAATVGNRIAAVDHYAISMGDLAVAGDGYLDLSDGVTSLRLAANVAPIECLDALESIPVALRGALAGLTPRGMLRGGLEVRYDATKPIGHGAIVLASLDVDDCDILADARGGDPASLLKIAPRTFVDGTKRDVGPGAPGYVALEALPAYVDGAFVTGEDARFFSHHGFEREQIARSIDFNLRDIGALRGASTISQQLVKNEFLDRDRTLARKLQEAVLTWRLEHVLTKRQILERYLNVIELGPGIWGIQQAAAFWFDVPASQLTPVQAAFLVAITPGPTSAARRIAGAGKLDDVTWERTKAILAAMRQDGRITPAVFAMATATRLELAKSALASLPSAQAY